ncbi:MAG: LysM peptidoglycan-binding domain-containing protein, partial [Desulfurellales bacterium]
MSRRPNLRRRTGRTSVSRRRNVPDFRVQGGGMDATSLDLRGAGDSIEGWVPFEQVGLLLEEPMYDERGYAIVPYEAAGFFDSIKKWVKNAAAKVAKVAKAGLKKVGSGLSAVLDSGLGQAAQNYLSLIPGFGTAASAALGGLSSALKGNKWSTVLMDAAAKAIPGGVGKTVFAAARGALDSVLKGKGIAGALGGAVKGLAGNLPGGIGKQISNLLGQAKETSGFTPLNASHFLGKTARVREARFVAQQLVDRPELRGLTTRQLAQACNVSPAVAQAGQAALLRHISPNAPAFPAGASLDTAGGFLGHAAAPVASAAVAPVRAGVPRLHFPRMAPKVISMLPHFVPGLRHVDPRFVALAAIGGKHTDKPRIRVHVANEARGIEGAKWRVSPGDYYAKIATAMGHPNEVAALIKANPDIKSPYTLFPGQLISLPAAWIPGGQPSPFPQQSPSPAPAGNTYTVKAGDTLQAIATKHGHPNDLAALLAANPQIKDANKIYPGDVITIPAGWVNLGGGTPAPLPAPIPLPRVEPDENDPEPGWYIPGTNPADYKLPDGTWETFPGEAYQSKLPEQVWARVQ